MLGWMDALQVPLSKVSKWLQNGFKHLFRGLVNPWAWDMTRTLRHLSRAETSNLHSFFEGCSIFSQVFLSSSIPFCYVKLSYIWPTVGKNIR